MPINDFKCTQCGFEKNDVLHKHNDEPKECPHCKEQSLERVVTSAGIKLNGTGYYETDFKHK